MGVELHIVRRKNYEDPEEESNITLDEWKALVENDPELTWKQYEDSDEETDYRCCFWLKHPDQDHSNRPWFNFGSGSVSTKWIHSPCLEKLQEMTAKLGARLETDDCEPLSEEDLEYLRKPQPSYGQQTVPEKKKPFWKFW